MRALKPVYTFLLIVAILLIECLIGGTRLVFSLPSYAIVALTAVLTLFSLRKPIAPPNLACLSVTGIFFAYILWRAAHSPVPFLAWMDYYMVVACLTVYLLTALYVTQTRLRTAVIVALLALAVVELFIGLRQFRFADNWMPFGFIRSDYGGRASGTFISSITLAGYLEVVGIYALSLAIWSTWAVWARVTLAYMALACYVGVAVTGSRGGYLSSAGSLVVLAIISLWIRRRVNPSRFIRSAVVAGVLLTIGICGSVAVMQKSTLLQQRLLLIGKPDIRWYNWMAALDQFKVSPWLGTGAGTHLYYGRLFRRPELQNDPEHAHSDYLELLAEFGIVGAVGMVVFIFFHVENGLVAIGTVIKAAEDDPYHAFGDNRLAFQVGAVTAISAYLFHSVTDFNLHIPGHAMIFAFIFGVTANPVAQAPKGDTPGLFLRFFQLALPALGIWMAVGGLPKFPGDYFTEQTRIAVRKKEYPAAVAVGQRALEWEKQNPFLYFHLGEACRATGASLRLGVLARPYYENAVSYYQIALRLYPQDENFWIRMAQAYDGMDELRKAEAAFQTALSLDPKLGAIHSIYAAHLRSLGWPEGAEEQIKQSREAKEKSFSDQVRNPLSETP